MSYLLEHPLKISRIIVRPYFLSGLKKALVLLGIVGLA